MFEICTSELLCIVINQNSCLNICLFQLYVYVGVSKYDSVG